MRPLKSTVKGTVVGIMVGAVLLTLTYAGLILSGGRSGLPAALVVSALAGSMAAGATCASLRTLVTSRERSLLAPLVTVAVAALVVLPGSYGNGSVVPPALYGMALVNGLLVARVTGVLCAAGTSSANRYLS